MTAQLGGPTERAERVRTLNRQLSGSQAVSRTAIPELRERSDALYSLIEADPALALSLALPRRDAEVLRQSLPPDTDLIESSGEWRGDVVAIVEDDFKTGRSRTRWRLRSSNQALELYFAGRPPEISCERKLEVKGIRLRNRVVAASAGTVDAAEADSCSTTGVQQTAVLMVAYPHTPLPAGISTSYLQDVFFGSGRSVSGFWNEASYGRTSAAGSVFGPFLLDADYDCSQYEEVWAAAIRAADAVVDFTRYSRVFIVMPDTGTCGWSGMGSMGCWSQDSPIRGSFRASVSWLTPETVSDRALAVAAHEGGHNLGLGHAASLYFGPVPLGPPGGSGTFAEYGDPFSNMGNALQLGHYSAQDKLQLEWLDGANVQTVQSSGGFTLAPLETASGGVQAVRVRRGLTDDRWLWLEYRQPGSAYERGFLASVFSGALIHYEDPADTAHQGDTVLLDFSAAATPNNFSDAALGAGDTWSDPHSILSLTVNGASAAGLSVTVSYGGAAFAEPASLTFAWRQGSAAPPPQSIALSATGASYAFTAATQSSGGWLGAAPASGVVPGSLSVAVNPAGLAPGIYSGAVVVTIPSAPNPTLTIPVTLTVEPAEDAPLAVSVTPDSGSGSGRKFSFLFSDPVGYARLPLAEVMVNSSTNAANSCYLHYDRAANTVALRNDAGTAWSSPLALGSSGTIENSQCVLIGALSSASGSGGVLSLELALSFKLGFTGAKNVYMLTQNATWSTGWQQRGTWTVEDRASAVGVTPNSGSGNSATFQFLYAHPRGAGELTFAGAGINSTAGSAGGCAFYVSGDWIGLFSDAGDYGQGYVLPGSEGVAENSSCVLYAAGSSISREGNNLTLNANIAFKAGFAGARTVSMAAADREHFADWERRGAWTATAAQLPVSVTPSSGSGSSETFRFLFSDPVSAANLAWVDVNFSPAGSTAGACYVRYDRTAGALLLRDDGGSGWSAPAAPGGSGILRNSQCAISAAGSSVSVAGRDLTLNLGVSFLAGLSGSIKTYMATPDSGWQLRGLWSVTAAPAMISVTPDSGSGAIRTFTFVMSDRAGISAADTLHVTFAGASPGSANECHVGYWQSSAGWLYLYDDAGTTQTSVALGSGSAQNSQCVLYGPGSGVSVSGQDLILTVALSFKAGFSGLKRVYMSGWNASGHTPWNQRGTWTAAPAQLPLGVTPDSGSGASEFFSFTFSDPVSAASLPWVEVNFSPAGNEAHACYLRYERGSGTLLLRNDAGAAWGAPVTAGGSGVLRNSQCAISAPVSTAAEQGPNLALKLGVSFLDGLAGGIQVYMRTPLSGWQLRGAWTVTGAPAMVSVTPDSGSGATRNFTFVMYGRGGLSPWSILKVLFNSASATEANACSIAYQRSSTGPGTVFLYDDAASGSSGSAIGSGTLENSQCVLDAGGSSVTVTGNDLTVTLAVSFKASFSGPKKIYMSGWSGSYTPWQQRGAWQAAASAPTSGMQFYPVTPCRIADTRVGAGMTGRFGPPFMSAQSTRSFPVRSSACGIPANATAYALNITVLPKTNYLGWLTAWGTGQPMPVASTLNAWDGRVVANAAIVPAGTDGEISLYVTHDAEVLFDINGYFAPPGSAGLQFYPLTPCRIADTRVGAGMTGAFGPPFLAAKSTRDFPIQSSPCGVPASARAYSLNMTVVPRTGSLGYLTTWGTGQPTPVASTLNSWTGTVVANAAIVPAGTNGEISIYVSDDTEALFDINGYFAPPEASGLQFYPLTPCRVADTRGGPGLTASLGPPFLAAKSTRNFPVQSSLCGVPAGARAYSLNMTVVPLTSSLQYLTTWGAGQPTPVASTLNSWTGTVVANAAIVPAGTNGEISIYASDATEALFDINGYFAPGF